MEAPKPDAPFVTFYSFKGGVGRSMALINTAGILAARGFSVLVLDLDLEAPGLSYLDVDSSHVSSLQLGFVDLLSNAKLEGENADLFKLSAKQLVERYTRAYKLPEEFREYKDGSLHIMPAGRFDGNYSQRFDELDLHAMYQDGLGEPLIRLFKKKLAEAGLYHYVLVDSRTGFSDEAGICTRDLADFLMILTGLNRQNLEGTSEFLRALKNATEGKKQFQIILSPVPNGEDSLVDEREQLAKACFEKAWGGHIDLSLQIPYHPQLALTEEPHIFRRRRGYLFEAYRSIEARMLNVLGHTAGILWQKITESLGKKEYLSALQVIEHMARLEDGKVWLGRVASVLCGEIVLSPSKPESLKKDSRETRFTLTHVFSDPAGKRIVEFIVHNVQFRDTSGGFTNAFGERLEELSSKLAEEYYRRLVKSVPNAVSLRMFARFLVDKKKDLTAGAEFWGRAVELAPRNSNYRGDYGQVLVGIGRFKEGYDQLLETWKGMPKGLSGNRAEVCYCLWLTCKLLNGDAEEWERIYRFFIMNRFKRHPWSFDTMLDRAAENLNPDELKYARLLAAAFIQQRKVSALAKNVRWMNCKPLNPDSRIESPAQSGGSSSARTGEKSG